MEEFIGSRSLYQPAKTWVLNPSPERCPYRQLYPDRHIGKKATIVKAGTIRSNHGQRWKCKGCGHTFSDSRVRYNGLAYRVKKGEDIDRAIEKRKHGKSIREIAKDLGVSKNSVFRWLKKFG